MSRLSARERRALHKAQLIARSDELREQLGAQLQATFSAPGLVLEAAGLFGRALRVPAVWWTAASLLVRWLRRRSAPGRRRDVSA